MTAATAEYQELTERVRTKLRAQEGVSGKTLAKALHKGRHRLPKHVRQKGQVLLDAGEMAHHPKLSLTLDWPGLRKAADEICAHLDTIDRRDRRKGFWLGMLGSMAFNVLACIVLFVVVLYWRGLV